jgi:two-component system, chemotaxis family, CheB/CheR fusion protein
LLDDLLDLARIASGKIALTQEPIEVSVLVDRARDIAQPLIDGRGQGFTVTVPAERLYVEGDLVRLTQVLGNLLNNASKYTGEGGAIALEVRASETGVEISVTDDGAGIAPDMLSRVLDLFAQEDRTLDRAQGGLGIGLTLVRRLVQLHGGSVEARSSGLGQGSQFLVRLPRLRLPLTLPSEQAPVEPARPADVRRVLVVDDNVDNAQSTAMLLELAGHEVRVSHDGTGALVAAAQFRPDVCLLDIGLPGMNGYDLARHLRGRQESAGARLIALTGYGQPEDASRAKAAGFDYHLAKPASPEHLLALVGRPIAR